MRSLVRSEVVSGTQQSSHDAHYHDPLQFACEMWAVCGVSCCHVCVLFVMGNGQVTVRGIIVICHKCKCTS